jgi:S1-C subfamily serine protease
MKHGTVQRAFLGIRYATEAVSDEDKNKAGIKDEDGVYVMELTTGGAAEAAGIKVGDYITKINGVPVVSGADVVGQIATYRPGDKIVLTYRRGGKEYTTNVTLRNVSGTTEMVKNSNLDKLGAELQTLSKNNAKELGINGGVVIKSISPHGVLSKVRIQEGYVILKANNKEVTSVEALRKVLDEATGSVKLEGMYPGYEGIYPIVINLN